MAPDPEITRRLKDLLRDPGSTAIAPPLPAPRPVAPEGYLVHIHPPGPTLGRRILIGPQPVVLGRSESCPVHDPDPLVSRTHARIELRPDGRFQITDLGSTNGTFVNHVRVASAVLGDGDYVRLGGSIYRFLAGGNVEAGYHEEIHRLAVTDPLTGLPNRRALMEFLDREAERARRYRRLLSAVIFDLDHFKRINDQLGHVAGDSALRALADTARPLVRKDELLARYGGDEFVVALPEATAEHACRCAERIRQAVEQRGFELDGKRYALTISAGVGTVGGVDEPVVADLLARADKQLYAAKAAGRNTVRV